MPMRAQAEQAAVENVVSLLYDGVTCQGDWYDALDAMRVRLGAACFHSFTTSRRDCSVIGVGLANFEAPAHRIREYELHHSRNDTRMAMIPAMPVGRVLTDHEFLGERTISRSPIYNDWLGPMGLRYTLATTLRMAPETQEVLGFMRPLGDGGYDAEDEAFCQRLAPHLSRASELRARMQQLALDAAAGFAALAGLRQALAILDGDGRVHYLNPAAEALAGQADGPCRVADGRWRLADAQAQSRFARYMAGACPAAGSAAPAVAGALRITRAGRSLCVTVLPLKASHPLAAFREIPLVLVLLADPEADAGIDPRLLGELLGLSPTESRLALLLASGRTIKDFAAIDGCSWHTARTHLKNLLRKTGCHRQVELVRLVQAMQAG